VLSQEGIGESIYPVSVGPLSEIQILVASHQVDEANKILSDYEDGLFEHPRAADENSEAGNEETAS